MSLVDKLILIAESNGRNRPAIGSALVQRGYRNVAFVDSGQEIFERLRQYEDQLSRVGAVIIGEPLPSGKIEEFCARLADVDAGLGIPVIVLSDEPNETLRERLPLPTYWVTPLSRKTGLADLPAIVGLALTAKTERDLRRLQEDDLGGELSQQKIAATRLKYLLSNDELTGLASRHSFERSLVLAMHRRKEFQQEGALLYLDLDRFSVINDLEGYEAGDRLMLEIVQVWRGLLPPGYVAARICGDEFCVLIGNVTQDTAYQLAETLRQAVYERQFKVQEEGYHITLSVGLLMLSAAADVERPGQLIARGHQAVQAAKASGRNMTYVYHEDDSGVKQHHADIRWAEAIRDALRESGLYLAFQPIMRLSDGRISHYEVLVRMTGRNGTDEVKPLEFIPAAERMGLIHKIDFWVVDRAIEFLAGLPPHLSYVGLSINLSTGALQQPALLSLIRAKLELMWVDPSRLTFEITETAAVSDFQQIRETIDRLRALGCRFSLDDFGAGFCSFDYLKKFPVDVVKIDGQFVRDLPRDDMDRVLVRAMTEVAKKLGKRVVAEFVDSEETLRILREIGVDYIQGYLVGEPRQEFMDHEFYTPPSLPLVAEAPSSILRFPEGVKSRDDGDEGGAEAKEPPTGRDSTLRKFDA